MKMTNNSLLNEYALPVADYAEAGGSFPLAIDGTGVVGSVTISGLADRDDHELVVEALCAVLERDYAAIRLEAT
jgi:uncharacterized protein (UPF0303 family)